LREAGDYRLFEVIPPMWVCDLETLRLAVNEGAVRRYGYCARSSWPSPSGTSGRPRRPPTHLVAAGGRKLFGRDSRHRLKDDPDRRRHHLPLELTGGAKLVLAIDVTERRRPRSLRWLQQAVGRPTTPCSTRPRYDRHVTRLREALSLRAEQVIRLPGS
jgi:hypothetical protein